MKNETSITVTVANGTQFKLDNVIYSKYEEGCHRVSITGNGYAEITENEFLNYLTIYYNRCKEGTL